MPRYSTEARLKELEVKVTYQDDIIASLDQVVLELRREVEALTERLRGLEQGTPDPSARPMPYERPPHY